MALIARDLMQGNPVLAEMGFMEESHGHNAIAAASRASGNGPTTTPTAISSRRSCAVVRLERAPRALPVSPPRTTRSTG
jgi:hypothetical protein